MIVSCYHANFQLIILLQIAMCILFLGPVTVTVVSTLLGLSVAVNLMFLVFWLWLKYQQKRQLSNGNVSLGGS